ncbi:hypothetical protein QQF64_008429 [Cirrhinus molitorella]|uniref:Uncharacterized protein n=1 Tax=Cirrhinus molitorella TaxID=172907 RepID=A0ABR3M644_9TELE
MDELKIQDGGCSPFLCCSRECASLSVALRLLFTQTDGSVFALGAASPSNWLSLSLLKLRRRQCKCVSVKGWCHSVSGPCVYLTQLAA